MLSKDFLIAAGSYAFIAGLVVVGILATIKGYGYHKERALIPSFEQCVDAAGCIGILIVVTVWLGVWDVEPSRNTGPSAQGDGLIRLGSAVLKGLFLVLVPAVFLSQLMRKVGGLGRRAAVYGAVVALALIV